ncbi:MAG: magnesium/cobalt transporter CorA [Dehalococcoidia bacterium]
MAVKAYYMSPDNTLSSDLKKEQLVSIFMKKQGLLWIDINNPSEEDRILLEQDMGFHHLAVEDCISPDTHPPKIDDYEDYIFLILHGINYQTDSEIVETAELALFIGGHYVISIHQYPFYSIQTVQAHVDESGRWMMKGADFLAHSLMDSLIDNMLPTIYRMSAVADELEEAAIRNPVQTTMENILKLKRSTLHIHRVIVPQREIVNRLSRGEFTLIKEEAEPFYRDIYDHLVQIEDLNRIIRDLSDNALSIYLSAVANRQNDTMKVLAMVTTIFLPLTLLTGIDGMNFKYMPELQWHWAYFCVLGVILFVMIVVAYRFWASKWFMWGRGKMKTRVRPFFVTPEKLTWNISKHKKTPDNGYEETG